MIISKKWTALVVNSVLVGTMALAQTGGGSGGNPPIDSGNHYGGGKQNPPKKGGGSGSNPPSTPGGSYGGGGQQRPPEPNDPGQPSPGLPNESLDTVRRVAREQGNMMANRVVGIYGEAERILRSFYFGLNDGVNTYNFVAGQLEYNQDFRNGVNHGLNEGRNAGTSAGETAGVSEGHNSGVNNAAARFQAVVDQHVNPDTTVPLVTPPQRDFNPQLPQVPSLETRLNQKNSQFFQIINSHSYYYEDYYAQNIFDPNVVTLGQLYGMHGNFSFNRFVDSYGRADWAFEAWADRSLGGQYQNAISFYRKISDAGQTGNASKAQLAFVEEFKDQFNHVIESKWASHVNQIDPGTRSAGMVLGVQAAKEYVSDLGNDSGYRKGFSESASRAYGPAFNRSFGDGFTSTVGYYQTHAVVSQFQGSIAPTEGWPYLPGAPLSVTVTKVSNAGRVAGSADVALSGSTTKTIKKLPVSLAPASSTTQSTTYTWMGQVSFDVTPDQDQTVAIQVGEAQVFATYKVFWWDVAQGLGKADPSKRATLADYAKRKLSEEWSGNGDKGNYVKGKTLLEQLVKAYNAATPAEKTGIAQYRETIRSAYGSMPGIFGKRDAWKNAQSKVDSLK